MQATAYISHLCPRCQLFLRQLEKLQANYPLVTGLNLEVVEVLQQPLRTWRAGIRMIPALQINGALYTSLFPRQKELQQFLADNLLPRKSSEGNLP